MIPTIGRIVHYKVPQDEAKRYEFAPEGPRFNSPHVGDILPMIITDTIPDHEGVVRLVSGNVMVNNGTMFWAGSVTEGLGDVPGQWFWPPRV